MKNLPAYLRWLAKGLVAATAAVGVLIASVVAASPGGASITVDEWWKVVLAVLGALGVIAIPNGDKPAK